MTTEPKRRGRPPKMNGEPVEIEAPNTMPVKLLRDFWSGPSADPIRHYAGEVLEITVAQAKEMIAAGLAERADAFPDE